MRMVANSGNSPLIFYHINFVLYITNCKKLYNLVKFSKPRATFAFKLLPYFQLLFWSRIEICLIRKPLAVITSPYLCFNLIYNVYAYFEIGNLGNRQLKITSLSTVKTQRLHVSATAVFY